ncbi:MAG: hydroxymethylglutaryl-CoA lyase [Chloroflexota bacterium]|nr:hydroxymethylglutaryl-CoA lyase [Chloroflexota bacterium]
MSLPGRIQITEVGPREGYQFEGIGQPDKISTADKIRLVEALAETGLRTIEVTSFVHPKLVPQMADAEAVVAGLRRRPDVEYSGIFLNDVGLRRAHATGKLSITGILRLTASETFSRKNQNRDSAQDYAMQKRMVNLYQELGIPIVDGMVMTAFGCNYEGDVPLSRVLRLASDLYELVEGAGQNLRLLILTDTMGWANPEQVRRMVAAVRERWPTVRVGLHLHDTRGLGVANVYASLQEGVDYLETGVGGLGGCPFAGHGAAAGNVCTEEVVFLCQELGIETGVDLERLVECARLAEGIAGHPLPSKPLRASIMKKPQQPGKSGQRT